MAWVKVDDRFSRGPKVTRASFELGGKNARGRVLAVWLDMMSYCNLNTTDGFVPAHEVATMADADPKAVIKAMSVCDERMGPLVEVVDGGWQMRNYAEYQPTRADLEAAKQRTAQRQKAWRERKSNSVTPPSRDVASQRPEPNRSEPERTEPERTKELTARAPEPEPLTAEANNAKAAEMGVELAYDRPQRARRQSVAGSLPINHARCHGFGALPSCARGGACIPAFLGQEWIDQTGGANALGYVAAFVSDEVHHAPAGPLGDPVKWWRARWDAKHRQAASHSKSSRTVDAARRVAERLIAEGRA